MNKQLIQNFIDNFNRVPTYNEFKKVGGSLSKQDYFLLLKKLYLKISRGRKATYQIYNRDRVVFIGSADEVAEEYGCTASNDVAVCKNNLLLKREYKVIKKEV